MRSRLSGLAAGLVFGIAFGAFIKYDDGSWDEAVGFGLAAGAFFGVAMGRWADRWFRTMQTAEGDLAADEAKAAHQAAAGGPVPQDPRIRAAALRIALSNQALEIRGIRRVFLLVVAGLITIGCVASAITGSPWSLVFMVGPLAILYGGLVTPRRTRERIRLLSSTAAD